MVDLNGLDRDLGSGSEDPGRRNKSILSFKMNGVLLTINPIVFILDRKAGISAK